MPRFPFIFRFGFHMKKISGLEILNALLEAEALKKETGLLEPLIRNACLVAASARRFKRPCFRSGKQALSILTPEQIGALAAKAAGMEISAGTIGEADMERLKNALKEMPLLRLRFLVLEKFGILPGEPREKYISDADILYTALHLKISEEEALDRLCPGCREASLASSCPVCGKKHDTGGNPAFSMERFLELKNYPQTETPEKGGEPA